MWDNNFYIVVPYKCYTQTHILPVEEIQIITNVCKKGYRDRARSSCNGDCIFSCLEKASGMQDFDLFQERDQIWHYAILMCDNLLQSCSFGFFTCVQQNTVPNFKSACTCEMNNIVAVIVWNKAFTFLSSKVAVSLLDVLNTCDGVMVFFSLIILFRSMLISFYIIPYKLDRTSPFVLTSIVIPIYSCTFPQRIVNLSIVVYTLSNFVMILVNINGSTWLSLQSSTWKMINNCSPSIILFQQHGS